MKEIIERGDLLEVKRLISEGAAKDSVPETSWTPLLYATYYDKPDIVRYLLFECKVDVNKPLDMGATPAFVAAEHQRLDCLKILHQAGADANLACPASGTTPLVKAGENGNVQIIKYLIEEMKANINQGQSDGSTPLFMACQNNRLDAVKYLLSKGVDANKGKRDSATPIIVASELGHTEVVRLLVNEAKVTSAHDQMYNGVTPLYKASEKGHLEIVKILCEDARVNPDLPKNDGVSPLFTACQMGHLPIIKYLAEKHNADINKPKNDGVTPLYMAAEYRNVEIVEYLVKRGANLHAQSVNGLSALHAACIQHIPRTVTVLVEAGADINMRDMSGCSPICNASEWGRDVIISELLRLGADANITGWNGNSALHIAAAKGHLAVVERLLNSDREVNINLKNKFGCTPLHLAVVKNSAICAALLEKGANPNLQDCNGNTPLHCAVKQQNISAIHTLTGSSLVDGSLKNLLGMNPLDLYHSIHGSNSTPERKILEEKAQLSGANETIPAMKFVEVAQQVMGNVSLENVKLVRRQSLMSAGEIPHYDLCETNGWHCTAKDLRLSDNVLFVSHRCGSISPPDGDSASVELSSTLFDFLSCQPDPTGEQYKILCSFLSSTEGSGIEYVWINYSCISQDRESELFGWHLQNIPTAVWASTHCLVIPQLVVSPYNNCPEITATTTHLTDYLGRSWCLLEVMAALLTGTDCFLAFQVGAFSSWERLTKPEEAASQLGFFMSYVKTWNHLFHVQQKDMMNINLNHLEIQWKCKEPCAILGHLLKISMSEDPHVKAMLQKALSLSMSIEDLEQNVPEINELWNKIEERSVAPEDKMVVLNLMLFIGYYSMNLFQGISLSEVEVAIEDGADNTGEGENVPIAG